MTARTSLYPPLACANPDLSDGWAARRPPLLKQDATPAFDHAHATLQARAKQTVRAMLKERARAYRKNPRSLDSIEAGLSESITPHVLVLRLARLWLQTRWGIWGGEVIPLNLRAAMIYARRERRIANRNARRTG